MTQHKKLLTHAKRKFGAEPDHPFEQYPNYAVLRHADNDKWFALFMSVDCRKLNLKGSGEVPILDVKCPPEQIGALRQQAGFLPAYHMNKEHWISVVLDGTITDEQLFELLDASFELTA
ncbi:MmcQ/YjbR family DNA-binding protein [Pseudomonas putida]|uniref:MmcQ/YjbR family DNA-binding protein n=1 Tax=Pseudomonas putida TaxID=303 RepID=UPI0018AB1851|nr:MmcQ/YjbR family DNA-binding protein [Pseudomonas putida]MBF8668349.1 MmcQ/YjbR family DNA-binding protein [Pseudomonas putida]MBF8710832.1 MmcQ/YjbR family DNA-binding protein [Pseudomonas putida]